MGYRETTEAWCHKHPTERAAATCATCLRPICEVCTIFEGVGRPLCPQCVPAARRARRIVRAAFLVVLLGLASGATWAGLRLLRGPRRGPPVDHGEYASLVATLEDQLGREPCDRGKTGQLMETLLLARDFRGAIYRHEVFLEKCGEHVPLRRHTFVAHHELNELDAAIADATKLSEESPTVADYVAWRATVREQKGELAQAVADWTKVMALEPASLEAARHLADAQERMGRSCDAVGTLRKMSSRHPYVDQEALDARIERLRKQGKCE